MVVTHKNSFNKRHGFNKDELHSLKEIVKITKKRFKLKTLQEVYNRGYGAYSTNFSSVRKNVKSPEQWGMARLYAFVDKIESGKILNHDLDLV